MDPSNPLRAATAARPRAPAAKPHTAPRPGLQHHSLFRCDGAPLVDGFPDDIHDPSQGLGADGDADGSTGVQHLLSPHQPFRAVHGDGAHRVLPCRGQSYRSALGLTLGTAARFLPPLPRGRFAGRGTEGQNGAGKTQPLVQPLRAAAPSPPAAIFLLFLPLLRFSCVASASSEERKSPKSIITGRGPTPPDPPSPAHPNVGPPPAPVASPGPAPPGRSGWAAAPRRTARPPPRRSRPRCARWWSRPWRRGPPEPHGPGLRERASGGGRRGPLSP